MTDFDQLNLDRSPAESPPPARSRTWLIVAVVLLLIGLGGWYWWQRPRDVSVRTETMPVSGSSDKDRPAAEPGEDIPLPPLDESDALVRELVSALSSHPRVAAWLTTDGLIRNYTVVVINVAQGRGPANHLEPLAPAGPFRVSGEGSALAIDPQSYDRYNGIAEAVGALDARGAARLYATLKPRIEEASKELGSTEEFDRILERALRMLLSTPIVEGGVPLASDSVSYKFADPKLEGLAPVQRQFLRMGPRNMRTIQAKLREIAGHAGIPPESLPGERVYRP
jgi:hypothetical protein